MQEEIMLTRAATIAEKYELLRKTTGSYFNIFEIAGIATKEERICRVIYELLSPTGCHYQGSTYLKLFLEKVIGIEELDESELQSAKVFREFVIPKARRIDLLIRTNTRIIPIEVKINARDREDQCVDYYEHVNRLTNGFCYPLYYLTRFGSAPEEKSSGDLSCSVDRYSGSKIICISFAKDILNWLELCIKGTDTWRLAPIREVLAQFILTIKKFTGQLEDREMKDMIALLRSSSKFILGAEKLEKALPEAKKALMIDLFDTIDRKVRHKKRELEDRSDIWNYKDRVKYYYDKSDSSFPCLIYLYQKTDNPAVELCVGIEIHDKLYVGYLNNFEGGFKNKNFVGQDKAAELQQKIKIDGGGDENSDWLAWKYITHIYPESPDFKNHNEAYYALFDKEYFEEYTEECAQTIVEMLEK